MFVAYPYSNNYRCYLLIFVALSGAIRLNLTRKSCVVRSLTPSRTFMEFGSLHFTSIHNNNSIALIWTLITSSNAIKNTNNVSLFVLFSCCFLKIVILCLFKFLLAWAEPKLLNISRKCWCSLVISIISVHQNMKIVMPWNQSWRLEMSENLDSIGLLGELCQSGWMEWNELIVLC